jgi:gamma-glutamylaminecyclotransferase
MRVFVYGTLRSGYSNHYRCLRTATFVGQATTSERYTMIDVGFPVLLTPGQGHPVHGEVYEVDADTVERLDMLEGKGRMYDRVRKYVRMSSGELVRLYYYVGCADFWDARNGNPVKATAGAYDWRP